MYKMKMSDVLKIFNSLCTPAQLYLSLSMLSILGLLMQNVSMPQKYTVGRYSVPIEHHNILFFVFKIIYVLIWTYLLDNICKRGLGSISWILVLLPLIMMFVLIGLVIMVHL